MLLENGMRTPFSGWCFLCGLEYMKNIEKQHTKKAEEYLLKLGCLEEWLKSFGGFHTRSSCFQVCLGTPHFSARNCREASWTSKMPETDCCFGIWFLWLSILIENGMECHHPNWRSQSIIFFRGVGWSTANQERLTTCHTPSTVLSCWPWCWSCPLDFIVIIDVDRFTWRIPKNTPWQSMAKVLAKVLRWYTKYI